MFMYLYADTHHLSHAKRHRHTHTHTAGKTNYPLQLDPVRLKCNTLLQKVRRYQSAQLCSERFFTLGADFK